MPIRILHIIGQLGIGGCETHLLELCRRMDRSRYCPAVCYYSQTPASLESGFREAGVRLYFTDKFGGQGICTFFQKLRGFVLDFKPDIIHTWQYSPNCWGRLAGLTCGYTRFICSERSATRFPRSLRVMEALLGRMTVYTANTRAVASALTEQTGFPAKRIRVIYNGIEVPSLNRDTARREVRTELGVPPDTPIVLTVGRQTAAKNYPMLFRAAQRVASQRPDVVFVAAGHGELEPTLRELHAAMGLGTRVRMLGLRRDVPRLMTASDIFCLCSRWEGFPNVLVEAMACGLPTVTTDFPGAREIVNLDGSQSSIVVDIDRDDQAAASIQDLLSDPGRCARLGQAGKHVAETRFSWPRTLEALDDLYRDHLDKRPLHTRGHHGRPPGGERA